MSERREQYAEVLATLDRLDHFVAVRKADHAHDPYNQGIERAVTDVRTALAAALPGPEPQTTCDVCAQSFVINQPGVKIECPECALPDPEFTVGPSCARLGRCVLSIRVREHHDFVMPPPSSPHGFCVECSLAEDDDRANHLPDPEQVEAAATERREALLAYRAERDEARERTEQAVREARAAAWDEGYKVGEPYGYALNPYREARP